MREGVYFDMSDKDYHADPAVSSSGCKYLISGTDGPLKFWHHSPMNPNRIQKVTPALKMGKAIHTALLEPEKFSSEFTVNRKNKTSSKPDILGSDEFLTVNKLKKFTRQSHFRDLLNNGIAETSVFWKDQETGVMCRCRFDYLIKANIIVDLKTINNLHNKNVAEEIFSVKRRYYLSAGMYVEGLRNLKRLKGVPVGGEQFYFLFITKDDPITIKAYRAQDDMLETGKEHFKKALGIYKACKAKYGDKEWRDQTPIETIGMDDAPGWFNYYE